MRCESLERAPSLALLGSFAVVPGETVAKGVFPISLAKVLHTTDALSRSNTLIKTTTLGSMLAEFNMHHAYFKIGSVAVGVYCTKVVDVQTGIVDAAKDI